MNNSVKSTITEALIFASISKKHLELVKHETASSDKNFINILIWRLTANENDCIARISDAKNRDLYISEIRKNDTFQFAHITNQLISMSKEKRDLAEAFINGLCKNEVMEFVEQ